MNLHPRDAVLEALDVNHRGFALVHHYLDVAVQEAAAQWEDRYPDLTQLHGAVLASGVRGVLGGLSRDGELPSTSLRMITVSNCGQHLYDSASTRYRILERPLSQASPGRLLPVTEPEIDTLFGTIPSAARFELAVLWSVAYTSRSLRKAVLAAVADIDNPKKAAIYAEEELPAPLAATIGVVGSRADAEVDEDAVPQGFGDYFGDEDEGFGDPS